MKKIVLLAVLFTGMLFGAEIQWAKNYVSAIQMAESTQKPILLLVEKENCPYCELLQEDVLSKASVASYINKKYIPVKVMINDGTYPATIFSVYGTPTTFFVNAKGEKYRQPLVGYIEKEPYLAALQQGAE